MKALLACYVVYCATEGHWGRMLLALYLIGHT
jgi:hypothetical protein